MSPITVSIVVFFAILFLLRAIGSRSEGKSEDIVNRVRTFSPDQLKDKEEETKAKKSILHVFAGVFRIFTTQPIRDSIEAELVQADVLLKPEEMLAINAATALLPALLGYLATQNFALAILMALVGAALPLMFLKNAKMKRLQKFNDQLGDALGIMSNSLRAGFSFLQAMDSLSKELPPPISTEFGRALKEMRLGTPTEEALANMTERIRSDDLDLIVTAVNIQRQVGGNLAEILDNIGNTISERVRMKGEIKTLTAQGRISGTIVALLPVFLVGVISVMNPSYIGLLFTHPLGLILIGGAVISELIGIMLIKKVINIEL
ncbi:type II secretion system F family protein [Dethiobacter alkaliphilus]|uniref:type II secretion system F family protein n=1 Tax=Dethiobacter alkaliphilus TaxID=427926 RepID=UPI002225FD2A|nr:type II secretion system F family protein [Dethiobacter alkaliphilus]MCW3489633.1 type II secretion system F family protein [Dethiobacter alkaliphilus]